MTTDSGASDSLLSNGLETRCNTVKQSSKLLLYSLKIFNTELETEVGKTKRTATKSFSFWEVGGKSDNHYSFIAYSFITSLVKRPILIFLINVKQPDTIFFDHVKALLVKFQKPRNFRRPEKSRPGKLLLNIVCLI